MAEEGARGELNDKKPLCVVRLMLEDGFCDAYFFTDERLEEDVIRQASAQI